MTNPVEPIRLLAEVEDLLRTIPAVGDFVVLHDGALRWLGRASAVIRRWDLPVTVFFDQYIRELRFKQEHYIIPARNGALTILHAAQHDLRMQTVGPLTTAIGAGGVFDYFDELRKVIETATVEVFFVDPYLDSEFVSRYLSCVSDGVSVRLLGLHKMGQLTPAVEAYRTQFPTKRIEVRAALSAFHDRFLFVDRVACYQSGASFKDGGKKAATTLTQIVDAFPAMLSTYESLWANGTQ